jgi:hypothetical protein
VKFLFFILLLSFSSLARGADTVSPEEDHGCGTDPKLSLDASTGGFCERYAKLSEMYGDAVPATYGLAEEAKACADFARASAKLRNVMCAYYKEATVLGKLTDAWRAKNSGPDAEAAVRTSRRTLHSKYARLIARDKGDQLVKYLRYGDTLKRNVTRFATQTREEAYSCTGSVRSRVPSVWLVSTNYLSGAEAAETEDKYQRVAAEALEFALAASRGEDRAARAVAPRHRKPSGTGEKEKETSPSLIQELSWSIFGDRSAAAGEIFTGVLLEQMALEEVVAEFASKWSGPVMGFALGMGIDYWRFGRVSLATWLNAFCGMGGLAVGLTCTAVLTLLDMDRHRMEAYDRFAVDYLEKNPRSTAKDVSAAFCERVERETAEARLEVGKAIASGLHSFGAKLQPFREDWERIQAMPLGKERDEALAEYRTKWEFLAP